MKFPALFKSSTLSGSLGLYVPAIALQKLLGLGRLLVFIHFMSGVPGQYNLWAAGIMVVDILSPLVCLGSNQGIARYVSVYQARGLLAAFYRRMRWGVLGLCIAMTLLAACGGDIIRRLAIDAPDARIDPAGQMLVVYAALACVLASALYMNLMGLLNGLRTYRLASAVELLLGVAFTLLGPLMLLASATGLAVLLAYLASLVLALGLGVAAVEYGFRRRPDFGHYGLDEPSVEAASCRLSSAREGIADEQSAGSRALAPVPQSGVSGAMAKVLRFSVVALASNVLWSVLSYISYRLTVENCGGEAGAVFQAFLRLDQQVMFLAAPASLVVFSHVARRWEAADKGGAMATLHVAFKALCLLTLSLAVLALVAAPLWVRVLPQQWRGGAALVPGLLLFFQSLAQLALLDQVTRLHERPIVVTAAVAVCGLANLGLGLWWTPLYGPVGAALAAGVGVFAAGTAMTILYCVASRTPLPAGVVVVLATPTLLLLPPWAAGAGWAALAAAAIFTRIIFSDEEKRRIVDSVRRGKTA